MSQIDEALPSSAVFICSVGGSIEPIIQSINVHKPAYLVFVASRDTREKIEEIRKRIDWQGIRDTQIITLSDYQDLFACVRDIRDGLQDYLNIRNMPQDTMLVADITGGTKVMSSAMTLVMMEYHKSRFAYVGGGKRGKDGVGVVECGHEKVLRMDNPWEVMGVREASGLAQAFNSGQYDTATSIAKVLQNRETEYSEFYAGIYNIVSGVMSWDIFDYKTARSRLQVGIGKLRTYSNHKHPMFRELFGELLSVHKILESLFVEAQLLYGKKFPLPAGCGRQYLIDLVSNAQRRASSGHYDDAVARLYSAIEKCAKIALARKGRDNSRLTEDDLSGVPGDFVSRYASALSEKGFAQLPLFESFSYLCALDGEDPVAIAFARNEVDLRKSLESRNMSLLAHGYRPVREEDYRKLFGLALAFMQIGEDELFQFPLLEPDAILF